MALCGVGGCSLCRVAVCKMWGGRDCAALLYVLWHGNCLDDGACVGIATAHVLMSMGSQYDEWVVVVSVDEGTGGPVGVLC